MKHVNTGKKAGVRSKTKYIMNLTHIAIPSFVNYGLKESKYGPTP